MNYVAVVNDIKYKSKKIPAREIWKFLFSFGIWVFAENAPHLRRLQPGDTLVIYLAGKAGRAFAGEAKVASEVRPLSERMRAELAEKGLTWFTRAVDLVEQKEFDPPRSIKDLLDKLSFIKHERSYGIYFRQAMRQLSDRDLKVIETWEPGVGFTSCDLLSTKQIGGEED